MGNNSQRFFIFKRYNNKMKLPIKKDLTEKDLYLLNSLRRKERMLNDEKDILNDRLNKVLIELNDIRIKIDDIELK